MKPVIAQTRTPILSPDAADLTTPGVQVVYDPFEAEDMGAFEETALTFDDAWDANADPLDIADVPTTGDVEREFAKAMGVASRKTTEPSLTLPGREG